MVKKATVNTVRTLTVGMVLLALAMISPFIYRSALRAYTSSKVIQIQVYEGKTFLGGGTGFYVQGAAGKTYILTNRHVCTIKKNQTLKIIPKSGPNKNKPIPAKIIEVSKKSDLCLIESPDDTSGILISKSLDVGDSISYIGHPRLQPLTMTNGEAVGYSRITVFVGVIGKDLTKAQCTENIDMTVKQAALPNFLFNNKITELEDFLLVPAEVCFQDSLALVTTFMIYPGASGSPIVNSFGRLVGVVYAGPQYGGWGWGVPLSMVKEFMLGR